jgi:EAL domain-containing protein (putative c-di-GMP-specific phosphodiesterase class I)
VSTQRVSSQPAGAAGHAGPPPVPGARDATPRPVSGFAREAGWIVALQSILRDPSRIRVHYQPIVDLRRGTVRGYEALARFPEAEGFGPRDWFDAAARLGYAGALEAQLIQAALVTRPLLTRERFIAVNVSPAALLSHEVGKVLADEASLTRIVIEVVEQDDHADLDAVRHCLDHLRALGARVAVDDAGRGYGSLDRVLALRPDFVKVDGRVIASIGDAHGALDLVRTLEELATRLDAWVIAEGIETLEQLEVVAGLGIPLGQGYVLGRPAAAIAELDRTVVEHLRRRPVDAEAPVQRLTLLAERVPAVRVADGAPAIGMAFTLQPHLEHVVLVGRDGQPEGLLDRASHERGASGREPLCLPGPTPVGEAARRAMARPLRHRYDPIVTVDQRGAYAGIVTVDRLVGALIR